MTMTQRHENGESMQKVTIDFAFNVVCILLVSAAGISAGLRGDWLAAVVLAYILFLHILSGRMEVKMAKLLDENAMLWDLLNKSTSAMEKAVHKINTYESSLKSTASAGKER